MNTTTEASPVAFPEIALNVDGEVLLLDHPEALDQFIHESLIWELDLTVDEIADLYDEDLLLANVAVYDSIGGREGLRLRPELTEERYWQLVEAAKI